MEIEAKIVLLSAKINPTEKELAELDALIPQVEDWDAFTERLMKCSTAPLFFLKLPNLSNLELIPEDAYRKIKKTYYYTLTRGTLMYQVLRKTLKILQQNGIDVIVLKGAYMAEALYEDVGLRLFSDIDLLVKETEAMQAFELLAQAGYAYDKNDEMFDFLYENVGYEHLPQLVYKGIPVELHVRLHKIEEKYKFCPEKMWKHAQKVDLAGVSTYAPDVTDLFIYTILHLNKHFNYGEVQFTGFNDVVNILELWRKKLDWADVIRRSIQYECEDTVFKFVVLVCKNYKAYVPDFIIYEYIDYLSEEDQELFEKYLSGFKAKHFSVVAGVNRMKNLKGFSKKLQYLLWMIFPSKKFMVSSYRIKNPNWFFIYYPYRHWLGFRGLIRVVKLRRRK